MSSESNPRYFHFMLGPIQEFISQARRTRDFWAGSFLLSWLSAVAIRAAEQQHGTVILYPARNAVVMNKLLYPEQGEVVHQARLPSRFKAQVGEDFCPDKVIDSVNQAWQALADLIYSEDLAVFEKDYQKLPGIWKDQVDSYWDMRWVITEDSTDETLLSQCKQWRRDDWPEQAGVKCMLMDGWQELSGASGPLMPHKKMLDSFWLGLRQRSNLGMKSDLREGEHLCALAFIKRRFSRYFARVKSGDNHGWAVPDAVPSVEYMAACQWLAKVINKVGEAGLESELAKAFQAFHDAAQKLLETDEHRMGNYPEFESTSEISCVRRALADSRLQHKWKWAALDGGLFFTSNLQNKLIYPEQELAKQVDNALAKLRKLAGMTEVSPFYAVLRMDGDGMTQAMSESADPDSITQGIGCFTDSVRGIVRSHSGFLIYSGGDDVLAILPVETALDCAAELHGRYQKELPLLNGQPMTISAAVAYNHVRNALTKALGKSHYLLDDVAKIAQGRDAIAVGITKPGGEILQWSQKWKKALNNSGDVELVLLAEQFQLNANQDAQFSSKFFYKIRERFELLNPQQNAQQEWQSAGLNEVQAVRFMSMEYLNSWGRGQSSELLRQSAEEQVSRLLTQCRYGDSSWKADGALVVRFLANEGVWS